MVQPFSVLVSGFRLRVAGARELSSGLVLVSLERKHGCLFSAIVNSYRGCWLPVLAQRMQVVVSGFRAPDICHQSVYSSVRERFDPPGRNRKLEDLSCQ